MIFLCDVVYQQGWNTNIDLELKLGEGGEMGWVLICYDFQEKEPLTSLAPEMGICLRLPQLHNGWSEMEAIFFYRLRNRHIT